VPGRRIREAVIGLSPAPQKENKKKNKIKTGRLCMVVCSQVLNQTPTPTPVKLEALRLAKTNGTRPAVQGMILLATHERAVGSGVQASAGRARCC